MLSIMKGILGLEFAWKTILTLPSIWVGILDADLMKACPCTGICHWLLKAPWNEWRYLYKELCQALCDVAGPEEGWRYVNITFAFLYTFSHSYSQPVCMYTLLVYFIYMHIHTHTHRRVTDYCVALRTTHSFWRLKMWLFSFCFFDMWYTHYSFDVCVDGVQSDPPHLSICQ